MSALVFITSVIFISHQSPTRSLDFVYANSSFLFIHSPAERHLQQLQNSPFPQIAFTPSTADTHRSAVIDSVFPVCVCLSLPFNDR